MNAKEARYLIRLANDGTAISLEQNLLLNKIRNLIAPLQGKAINLRVTPTALEFDLFIAPAAETRPYIDLLKGMGKLLTCKRLDIPPAAIDPVAVVTEARQLFNEQRFWEVHEVLEGLWKELHGAEKDLVQGLIIAAAALVHVQKNEPNSVWSMLGDAMRRLKNQPDHYLGWNVKKFRDHFARVLVAKKIDLPTV